MDGEDDRTEALERRIRRLERRIARLEAAASPAGAEVEEPGTGLARMAAQHPSIEPPPPQPPERRAPPPPTPPEPPAQGVPPAPAGWDAWPARATHAPARTPSRAQTRAWPEPIASSEWTAPGPAAVPDDTAGRSQPSSISLRDIEDRFAGRALAWVGGFALVAAAVFFLSLAFSRGWITEPMRVLIGLGTGIAAFAGGTVLLARREALVGNVLTGVGLGIVSVALLAATRLYGLVPPQVGLLGALIAASAAAVVAVRFNARSVAAFGLVAALAAPPLVGASPTILTLLFLAVALVGTTAISLFRSWRWLPSLAFVLAAPQLAGWLTGDVEVVQGLVALAGFWAVNIVAAAGEEVRIRRDDLRPSSATLVLASGTFLLWGLFMVLDHDLARWRGSAVAIASLAHLLVGGWFLARQGLRHLFGNLVAGTGVALLAIASFVQLGAPAVPVAWAAEAVALAWLAVRRRHAWSARVAMVLGALVLGHLLVVEYPLLDAGIPARLTFDPPLLHAEAGSLGAVLLALGVTSVLVPVGWVRSALVGTAVLVADYAATFEFQGPWLAAAFVAAGLSGLVLDGVIRRARTGAGLEPLEAWTSFRSTPSAAAAATGALAVILLVQTEFPAASIGTLAGTPFLNGPYLSLAIVLAGLVAGGALVPVGWLRSGLAGIGTLLVAWALGFQVNGVALVAGLAVLLPLAVILDRGLARLPDGPGHASLSRVVGYRLWASAAGAVAWSAGLAYALSNLLDPLRWGAVTPPPVPFSDERALAAALLAGAALAAARWLAPMPARRTAVVAAIAVGALVVPFEVYADAVVVLWVLTGAVALAVARWDRGGEELYAALAPMLWLGGSAVALLIVAQPDRLWVADPDLGRGPLPALWPVSLGVLAVAAALAPRHGAFARWQAWLQVTAGVVGVYAVSVAVVDVFAREVGGSTAPEELAKQAQVALSVCWTAIGAVALLVGVAIHRARPRYGGFALLALATAKVFVIDLGSMDVAYRALVLAGVGLLLLASAYLFARLRGPRPGRSGLDA